eukprot:gene14521-17280_t
MSPAQIEVVLRLHNDARRARAKEGNCAAMLEQEWSTIPARPRQRARSSVRICPHRGRAPAGFAEQHTD